MMGYLGQSTLGAGCVKRVVPRKGGGAQRPEAGNGFSLGFGPLSDYPQQLQILGRFKTTSSRELISAKKRGERRTAN